MNDNAIGQNDAFKARMVAEMAEPGNERLAHQSLGRSLTSAESDFADALMEAYADGAISPAEIAENLTARGVAKPSSGRPDWTAKGLEAELAILNNDLDAAYVENGHKALL